MSLAGPRAKIDRAVEHKDTLETAIDEWMDDHPLAIEAKPDPDTGWFTVTYRERKAAPLRVGAIFGDFVSNLEAALDLLVYQLVIASGNTPSTGNYFPVVTIPDKWTHARKDKLKGVQDSWTETIKDKQPFHDGARAHLHWLAILHTANKINKHNVVSPAIFSSFDTEPTFELNRDARPGEFVVHDPDLTPPGTGSVLVDGMVLDRMRAVSAENDLEIVRLAEDPLAHVGIGFDLGIQMDGAFPDLVADVVGVVDEFEQVFGP